MSATGSGSGKAKKSVKTTRKKKLARKAVSMPDLGPDRPDRPDRKVGLPKISTRIRESQPMILTSPTCLAILEQLHELVSGPWSSSAFLPLSPSVSGASSTASPPHPTRVAASSTPPLTRARSVSSASSTSSSSSSPRSSSSSSSSSRRDASLTKRQSSECSLPDLEMRAGDVKIGTSLLSGSPISASAPSLLQPTKDVLKDGTRASSGDSYHFQVSTITNAAPSIFAQTTGKPPPAAPVSASFSTSATHPVTLDVRRKIGKYILALKRVLDKDGSSVDSQAQKILFSKSTPNIAVLIKCLRIPDPDIPALATHLLTRFSTTSESNASNLAIMARKGLSAACVKCLQNLVEMKMERDEMFVGVLGLVGKVAKYDPKLPLLARLHDSVPPTLHLLRRWHEQKQYSYLTVGLQALRVFSKNENNMGTMLKLEVVQFLTVLLKVHPKVEVVELLGILVKTNSATHCSIPVTYLLALLSSGPDPVQRAVCKVLKVLLETDEGRQKFVDAGGVKTVMETLDSLSAAGNNGGASEMTASVPPSTGPNTLFNFLLTLLRSAISRTDLPFISQYTTLKFPLPSPVASFSTLDLIPPSPLTAPSSTTRAALGSPDDVTHLFPENDLLSGLPTPTQALPATIQVRHVQPIVRHFGLANRWSEAPEPLGKKVGPRKVVVVDELKKVGEAGEVVYEVGRGPCGSDRTALIFDSRFESGNLQMAIKIGDFEYDLVLQSDINSPAGKHNQWFYFSVQNMISGQPYTFNIVNMSKPNSQFNQGMQPVMFSMAEGLWRRVGRDVCYYKNHYRKPTTDSATNAPGGSSTPASKEKDGGSAAQNYATLTVNYTFPAEDDTCLIAYHYPYTYSDLQRMLFQHQLDKSFGERCRRQTLCKTLGGNEVALLTITDFTPASTSVCPVRDRMYVFLSARVHPGESNSSHIMHGLLSYLLSSTSDTAVFLRQHCIFKIVPMLNPDGVVNGSHRCSLAGVDLNRQWRTPDKVLCPEIWWTKRIWKAVCETPWTDVSSILESMALPPPAPPSTPTGSRRVAMNGSCDKGVAPQAMPSRASTPPQSSGRKVLLACDFHGHSRKKSTFLFTCLGMPSANASNDLQSAQQANQQQPQQSQSLGINMTSGSQTSWFSPNPSLTTTNASFSSASGSSQSVSSSPLSSAPHPNLFPSLLASFSPIFDPSQTTHTITPAKESTARAVLHRELGIYHAYTFESSYCGSDVGAYPSHSNGESLGRDNVAGKGFQFRGKELREAGVDFVRSLKVLAEGEVAAAGLASGAQTATSSAGIGACGNSSIANSTVGGLASRA